MPLSTLHTASPSYLDERNSLLKHWENDDLYRFPLSQQNLERKGGQQLS